MILFCAKGPGWASLQELFLRLQLQMSAGPSSEYHSAELSLPWKPHRGSYVLFMRPCNESQRLGYLVNFFFRLSSPLSLPSQAPPTHFPMKLCSLDWPVPGQWTQHQESRSGRGSRGTGNTQRAGSFFTACALDPRKVEWMLFPE